MSQPVRVHLLFFGLMLGCASESPELGARARDATVPIALRCAAPVRPPPLAGFAVRADGEVVGFELESGREIARHSLGSEVVDLEWDERSRRLMVATTELFDVEGGRVHALSFEQGVFAEEAASEVFPGELRVVATPERVLVLGGELAPQWWVVDDELAVMGTTAALPLPELVGAPDVSSLFALRREGEADIVYRVSDFATTWSSIELVLPRPAPERAVVLAGSGQSPWLLRPRAGDEGLELAALGIGSFRSDAAPAYRPIPAGCASGRPHAVAIAGCAVVTVVRSAPEIVLSPLDPRADASCASLRARLARSATWLPKNLLADASTRRLWVATERGVDAYGLDAPISALPSFSGGELRAPLALQR